MEDSMRIAVRSFVFLWAAALLLATAPQVRAEPPAIVTVISVKVKGDGSAYLKKLQEGKPIMMRLGAKSYRVFRAAIAGEETGRIISVSEYENAEAFGKARAKRADDEAFKKWLSDLQSSNVSEDVHASLLEEVQP
jgi:hypothetical protein